MTEHHQYYPEKNSTFAVLNEKDTHLFHADSIDGTEIRSPVPMATSDVQSNFTLREEDRSYDWQLSSTLDPIFILRRAFYYLSGNTGERVDYDIMQQIMDWFVHIDPHVLEGFLRIDLPTIQQSCYLLLHSAFFFEKQNVFISIMNAVMDDAEWITSYGNICLIIAAWFDCHDICQMLLKMGISPNQVSKFPPQIDFLGGIYYSNSAYPRSSRSYVLNDTMSLCSLPLVKEAVRGKYASVKVLLQNGASTQSRCHGYTAAGCILLALCRRISG
jgi:hypothetical protein